MLVTRGALGSRKAVDLHSGVVVRCGAQAGAGEQSRRGHSPTEKAVWPWRRWTGMHG